MVSNKSTTIDWASVESLETALQGVDVVVSALSFESIHAQENLVIAAAKAGVKRFIPSEYGNDIIRPELEDFPIYRPKNKIRKLCEKLAAQSPRFTWTTVQNASFLGPDWTLDFIVDVKERTADIKDGGDVPITATTYEHVATAILGIIHHLDETVNRPVKISSINSTQNEIVSIAKELGAVEGWQLKYSRTEDQVVEAFKRWADGDHGDEVVAMFINRAFIGFPLVGHFPINDNELLGITSIGREGLKKVIEEAINR